LLGADIYKRSLDSRQYGVDATHIDVAHHTAGIGPINQQLDELIVLEDGDAGFPRRRIDKKFSFHRWPLATVPAATRRAVRNGGDSWGDAKRRQTGADSSHDVWSSAFHA